MAWPLLTIFNFSESKPILFDPNEINEYNVVHGGHSARPSGNVKWFICDDLFLIHSKFVGYDYYEERIKNRIVSQWNLSHGIDGETKKTIDKLHKEFDIRKAKRFKWSDIKSNFSVYYKNKIDHHLWGGQII